MQEWPFMLVPLFMKHRSIHLIWEHTLHSPCVKHNPAAYPDEHRRTTCVIRTLLPFVQYLLCCVMRAMLHLFSLLSISEQNQSRILFTSFTKCSLGRFEKTDFKYFTSLPGAIPVGPWILVTSLLLTYCILMLHIL